MDYYRTQTSLPLTKPRLIVENNVPRFVNSPIMSEDEIVSTLSAPETNVNGCDELRLNGAI